MIVLSFDVEERFHSHLTDGAAKREWKAGDRIARIVDLLLERGRPATFFVVGELAEHYPALIRRIADAGFEVASHSYAHIRLDGTQRAACIEDLTRAKRVLEDLTGQAVVGFRAPTWSATLGDDWLWEHLIAQGFRYDSSLFPFPTHMYGSRENPVRPFWVRPGLAEIPPSVWQRSRVRIPYGGGFYFRLYPAWLTRRLIESDLRRGRSPLVYLHPWDFEREERAVEHGALHRFIGTVNTESTWERLQTLLARHETRTVRSAYEEFAAH